MITRDSLGKCLPMVVSLPIGASWEQIDKAMTVNTFNLAVKIALENGEKVIYQTIILFFIIFVYLFLLVGTAKGNEKDKPKPKKNGNYNNDLLRNPEGGINPNDATD